MTVTDKSFYPGMPVAQRAPFWLLLGLLAAVFFTGGSTWSSEPQLMLLRPLAVIAAGFALLSLRAAHLRHFAPALVLFAGAALLALAHLIPLPYAVWSQLPGRDVIVSIDQAASFGQMARPLSMSPDATINALVSLSVPLAILLLAIQLSPRQHQYAFAVVLALSVLSGAFGLLQAGGSNIEFYPLSTENSGLFANRNHQGALLAMLLPMAAALAMLEFDGRITGRVKLALSLAIAVIAIPLVVVTGSRSGLFLLGVGLIFALLIWASGRSSAAWSWQMRLALPAALATCALGLIGLTVFAARDVALDRLETSGEDLRWPVWQSIIDMLPAYMPWGTGIGTYAQAYQVLEPDALLRPTSSNHAHNEVLEIALTAGVPGLVLAACAAVLLVLALWRSFAGKPSDRSAAVMSQLGGVMILLLALASMTDYPVRTPILSAILVLASVWASLGTKQAAIFTKIQGGK